MNNKRNEHTIWQLHQKQKQQKQKQQKQKQRQISH